MVHPVVSISIVDGYKTIYIHTTDVRTLSVKTSNRSIRKREVRTYL